MSTMAGYFRSRNEMVSPFNYETQSSFYKTIFLWFGSGRKRIYDQVVIDVIGNKLPSRMISDSLSPCRQTLGLP